MRIQKAVTPVILLLALSGCVVDGITPSTELVKTLAGEQIFRGLFLGEEPVAGLFPELWGGASLEDPNWNAERQEAFSAWKMGLIAQIQHEDAAFFARFRAEATSGHHVRIARIMEESQELLTAAAQRTPESGAPDAGVNEWIMIPTFHGSIFIHFIGMCTNVAGNVCETHDQGGGSTISGAGRPRLQRDQVVQMIASRLQVR